MRGSRVNIQPKVRRENVRDVAQADDPVHHHAAEVGDPVGDRQQGLPEGVSRRGAVGLWTCLHDEDCPHRSRPPPRIRPSLSPFTSSDRPCGLREDLRDELEILVAKDRTSMGK